MNVGWLSVREHVHVSGFSAALTTVRRLFRIDVPHSLPRPRLRATFRDLVGVNV